MLKLERNSKSFTRLATPSLAESSITERYDLQECIKNSPNEFFSEINEELFLIGSEVTPSQDIADRIDLLAIDRDGRVVVIELKRGSNKLQMMQAISYAGMISHWSPVEILDLLTEAQQDELSNFLHEDFDQINSSQRVILVAEGFDYALLVGAQWLCESYRVDISCCRISMATESDGQSEYLACSTVYPAKELVDEAAVRGRKGSVSRKVKWLDWDSALEKIENDCLVQFFRKELEAGRDNYLRKRVLRFRTGGKRRWNLKANQKLGYTWQHGRFSNDIEFWQTRLSDRENVQPVKAGQCLRFYLVTAEDFDNFKAATMELSNTSWTNSENSDEEVGTE